MGIELHYECKGITAEDIKTTVDELWNQLWNNPAVYERVKEDGVDLEGLQMRDRNQVIDIETAKSSGISPEVLLIVKFVATLAEHIAKDLWEIYLLPRIKKDKGEDSLVPKKDG